MEKSISDILFRSLGTHALKEIAFSETEIKLVVAPWEDLQNEAIAVFEQVEILYIEAESGDIGFITDFNLPWDIIRFDSTQKEEARFEFGLCCSEVKLGFSSPMPRVTFKHR